jgi:hypothetical protein
MTQTGNIRQAVNLTREELLAQFDDEFEAHEVWPVVQRHLRIGEWEAFQISRRRATPWDGLLRRPEE